MNDTELDHLLSASLPSVEDAGFSHSAMMRVLAEQRRKIVLEAAVIVSAITVLLFFLPTAPLVRAMEIISLNLGNPIAMVTVVSVAISAIVLSGLFVRMDAGSH